MIIFIIDCAVYWIKYGVELWVSNFNVTEVPD